MNNTNEQPIVDNSCPVKQLPFVINSYVIPSISGLGILTNTWCIVVFVRIIRNERSLTSHMFKYLLLKAVHDDIQFFIQIFAPLYYCSTCSTYQSYSSQVWYIWFYYYVECINELCSGMYEVAATFDCLITINQKLACCKKQMAFYLTSIAIFLFSAGYYVFFIFNFTIVGKTVYQTSYFDSSLNLTINLTSQYFVYEYTEFSNTQANSALKFAHGIMRDVALLFISMILNLLLLLTMKKSIAKKKNMTIKSNPTVTQATAMTNSSGRPSIAPAKRQSQQMSSARRAERNMTIMLIITGIQYFFGHVMSFVRYCFLTSPSKFRSCWMAISMLLFYLSYATPFLIYIGFNKLFRTYAFRTKVSTMVSPVSHTGM